VLFTAVICQTPATAYNTMSFRLYHAASAALAFFLFLRYNKNNLSPFCAGCLSRGIIASGRGEWKI